MLRHDELTLHLERSNEWRGDVLPVRRSAVQCMTGQGSVQVARRNGDVSGYTMNWMKVHLDISVALRTSPSRLKDPRIL